MICPQCNSLGQIRPTWETCPTCAGLGLLPEPPTQTPMPRPESETRKTINPEDWST